MPFFLLLVRAQGGYALCDATQWEEGGGVMLSGGGDGFLLFMI
jgi:hypothetical protein